MLLEDLQNAIDGFKEVLKQNLEAEKISHSAVLLWLIRVFSIANGHLQGAKNLEDKGLVFSLMKTMHPFLEANKDLIRKKLDNGEEKSSLDVAIAMQSFEKQTEAYAKYLKAANREKGKKNRIKFKKRGLI